MAIVANLEVLVGADIDGLTKGLNKADKSIADFGKGTKAVGQSITGLGANLTTLTAPLDLFLGAGIMVASEFDSLMAEISARTGIVGDDLSELSDFALQMGADTAFSAQEAGEALLQLVTSGASATDAMAMLPAILDAAAASGADLGFTADAVTDIMSAFGLEIDDTRMVVDALAQAAGASSADIESLTAGFQNVGPVASAFGLSVNDTAAALAVLSENGIKGAEAGTALKSMLMNMTRDTVDVKGAWNELGVAFYDAAGNARPLETVIAELDTALDALPAEQQNRLMQDLAGSYGIVALNALRGELSITEMKGAMDESASASEVAKARMDTFAGRVDSLKGSVEALMITALTPLLDNVLKPLIEQVTGIVNQFTEWAGENPELAQTLMTVAGGAALLGPALIGLGLAISAVGGAMAALAPMLPALALLGVALATFDFPKIGEGLTDLKTGIEGLAQGDMSGFDKVGEGLAKIGEGTLGSAADKVIELIERIGNIQLPNVGEGLAAWGEAFKNAWLALQIIVDNIKRGIERFVLDIEIKVVEFIAGFRQTILDITAGGVDIAPDISVSLTNLEIKKGEISAADALAAELNRQMAEGDVNITGFPVEIDLLAENLSVGGKETVNRALQAAITEGDVFTATTLLPLAEALEIDPAPIQEKMRTALNEALALGGTEGEAAFNALVPLATQLGIETESLQAQFQASVDMAAQAMLYQANLGVDITLTPTSVNTSAVDAAVKTATAGAGGAGGPQFGTGPIPAFQTGGMMPHTGLAFLHKGEEVLTPSEARRGGGKQQTFNLTTYGNNAYEVLQMLRRAAREAAPA